MTGQVIHNDARGDRVGARVRARRPHRSALEPEHDLVHRHRGRRLDPGRRGAAAGRGRRGGRLAGRTRSTAPGPTTPTCGRSSSSSRAPDDAFVRGILPAVPGSYCLASLTRTRPTASLRRRRSRSPGTPPKASRSDCGQAEEAPELAEDPGGRAPDEEPVDPVGAVAERPVADRPLDDLDRRAGRNAASGASRIRATSVGLSGQPGRRSAIATTGVTRKSLTGIQTRSSGPTTRTPAASASSPTSSAASRSAVATRVGVAGLGLPPGKLTSPRVMAVVARRARSGRSGRRRRRRARRARAPRPAGRSRSGPSTAAGRRPSVRTGMSSAGRRRAAAAGSGRRAARPRPLDRTVRPVRGRSVDELAAVASRFGSSRRAGRGPTSPSAARRSPAPAGSARRRCAAARASRRSAGLGDDRRAVGREDERARRPGRRRR